MRRLFATLCTFVLLISAAPASGQSIGLKFGVSSSILKLDPDAPQTRLTEFGGGGFFRWPFHSLILQLEVLALTKGAGRGLASAVGLREAELKLNYIEIPLTTMVSLGKGAYIFGGGAPAFETDCSVDGREPITNEHRSLDCDSEPTVDFIQQRSFDFGLTAGAGYEVKIGPGAALVEGRHTWGLTNTSESDLQSVKNRAFVFFLGYSAHIPWLR